MAKNKKPAVTVRHRTMSIPRDRRWLGVERDRNAELVEFVLPRVYQGVDLGEKMIFVDTMNAQGGLYDTAQPEKCVTEEEIHLRWVVGPLPAFASGKVKVRLRALGPDFVWQTEIGEFNLAPTFLGDDPPDPPGMGYFSHALLQVAELRDQAALSAASAGQSFADAKQAASTAWEHANAIGQMKADDINRLTSPTSDTGPIAQIHPVEGLLLDVTARLIAGQEGSDEPSPENVRPIAGKSEVKIARTGRNLISPVPNRQHNGVNFSASGDGTITLNGTSTASANVERVLEFPIPAGTYRISLNNPSTLGGVNSSVYLSLLDVNGAGILPQGASSTALVRSNVINSSATITITVPAYRYRIVVNSGNTLTGFVCRPQLELGSIATPYEHYTANAYNLALPQTVYGVPRLPDECNPPKGSLLVRTSRRVITGQENWVEQSGQSNATAKLYRAQGILNPNGTSPANNDETNGMATHFRYVYVYNSSNTTEGCFASGNRLYIRAPITRFPDTDALIAWLQAQHAAGTPLEIIYERATPQTLAIPPTTIPALPGANNIWSDGGGDTTAAGRLSPQYAYSQINARLAALEALATQP